VIIEAPEMLATNYGGLYYHLEWKEEIGERKEKREEC